MNLILTTFLKYSLKNWSYYFVYFIIISSGATMLGWCLDVNFLKRPLPGLASMNPVSGLLFMLIGLTFWLITKNYHKTFLYSLTAIPIVIGTIQLFDLAGISNFAIDHLLFQKYMKKDELVYGTTQMAPHAAICFIVSGFILLLLISKKNDNLKWIQGGSLLIFLIALLSIIGYIYQVPSFYSEPSHIPMSLSTSICFLFLSLTILFHTYNKGIMTIVTYPYSGSSMARLLIPSAILIPILLGYIRLYIHWKLNISTEFGVTILILSIIIIFLVLIYYTSISLNKRDKMKMKAEEELAALNKDLEQKIAEESEKRITKELEYHSLIEQATDGIFISDSNGKYTDVNLSACHMLGYTRDELLNLTISDLISEEDRQINPPRLRELNDGKTLLSVRNLKRKDGTLIPVEINGKMLRNGKIMGIVRDITERKNAEKKLAESEILFRQTLDNMMEGVQIHSFDWKYTYVNTSLVKYSQYKSKEDLLGFTLMEKYPGIEDTEVFKVLDFCMKHRTPKLYETEFTFPNGVKSFFELSIQPIATGLFILSFDITERKKAEEAIQKLNEELEEKVKERTIQLENNIHQLRTSEEKFQKAFHNSPAGITISRLSDGLYLEVNDAFSSLIGYRKNELIGKSSLGLGIVVNIQKREEVVKRILEEGYVKHFEATIRNKNGELIDVLVSTETIVLNGDKYAINIILDITDRKKAEKQLEHANRELEAFSYSVSHDLRAPLRAIDGYAKILEEDYQSLFDKEGNRLLGVIQSNSTKMSKLIDDLLEFSRLGRKEIQKTQLDMNILVKGIIMEFKNHKAEIKIDTLFPSEGDYTLISQVMYNLIGNAIKYSSKKENPIIEISSENRKGEILYSIKDNGAGFDMQYADKLFGVFQRLHSIKEFEGTGVGLAIVQRIILKHGGKVWAESAVHHGATFYFTLPIKQL